MEAHQATNISDQLMTAVRLGKFRIDEIAPTIGRVVPLAKSMGVSFHQIVASVAALTVQGAPASEAMTQIRAALVALAKDGSIANKLFRDAADMTFPDFIASGGTVQEALQMIVQEADRTGQSVPQAFGRVEGSMAAFTLAGEEAAETFSAAMSDIAGATEEAFGKIEDTSAEAIARLKTRWSDLVTTVGKAIVGSLTMIDSFFSGQGVGRYAHITPTQQFSPFPAEGGAMAAWMRAQPGLAGTVLGQEGGLAGVIEAARQERDSQIVAAALGFGMAEAGPTRYRTVVRQAARPGHEFGTGGFGIAGHHLTAAALGLPYDWEGGIPPAPDAGGGGGRDLADAVRDNTLSNRELAELMRSGQALTVQLDANIDEGVILRADTVQRATGQVAARMGNQLVNRVRSGWKGTCSYRRGSG